VKRTGYTGRGGGQAGWEEVRIYIDEDGWDTEDTENTDSFIQKEERIGRS